MISDRLSFCLYDERHLHMWCRAQTHGLALDSFDSFKLFAALHARGWILAAVSRHWPPICTCAGEFGDVRQTVPGSPTCRSMQEIERQNALIKARSNDQRSSNAYLI
jgi:hypothetical protein